VGGVYGGVQLIDSTVSGNTVDAANLYQYSYNGYDYPSWAAGGMFGRASAENSTITDNHVLNAQIEAHSVGGVLGFSTSIRNTIIAKNENLSGDADVSGSFVSQGHNLIRILGANATGFVDSDLQGTSDAPLDPLLDPLADNGGWTKTHMLRRGSPAIDAGDSSNLPTSDQCGYVRVIGDAVDIGSVEWKSHPLDPQELARERGAQPVLATLRTGTSAELSRPPTRALFTQSLDGNAPTARSSRDRLRDRSRLIADQNDSKLKLSVLDDLFASLTADGF
jgi:hypothetical protein